MWCRLFQLATCGIYTGVNYIQVWSIYRCVLIRLINCWLCEQRDIPPSTCQLWRPVFSGLYTGKIPLLDLKKMSKFFDHLQFYPVWESIANQQFFRIFGVCHYCQLRRTDDNWKAWKSKTNNCPMLCRVPCIVMSRALWCYFAGGQTRRSLKIRCLRVHTVMQCCVRRSSFALAVRTTFHSALLR